MLDPPFAFGYTEDGIALLMVEGTEHRSDGGPNSLGSRRQAHAPQRWPDGAGVVFGLGKAKHQQRYFVEMLG